MSNIQTIDVYQIQIEQDGKIIMSINVNSFPPLAIGQTFKIESFDGTELNDIRKIIDIKHFLSIRTKNDKDFQKNYFVIVVLESSAGPKISFM